MLATITVLALAASTPPESSGLAPISPTYLVAEIEHAAPDATTIAAQFHLDTGEAGALRIDTSSGAVESEFSVNGELLVWLRHADGEEPESWLSPDIESKPDIMRHYWGVMSDRRLYEPEVAGKNPACGAVKWGFKALVLVATVGCCKATGGVGCSLCTVGADAAKDYINSIDCNKECNPDCPIP